MLSKWSEVISADGHLNDVTALVRGTEITHSLTSDYEEVSNLTLTSWLPNSNLDTLIFVKINFGLKRITPSS